MLADVGDRDFVARYLFEKIGHTAFLAIVLYAILPMFEAAIAALVLYLIIDKTVVRIQNGDWSHFWRSGDFWRRLVYLNVVGSLVIVFASASRFGIPTALIGLGVWLLTFLAVDFLGWSGRPA